jgi:hypothetical protein
MATSRSRLHQVQGGIVSQHVAQERSTLINESSNHAYRVIALTRILARDTSVNLETVIADHAILRELTKGKTCQKFTRSASDQEQQRQQHEDRIQHYIKWFDKQINAGWWSAVDITKQQQVKNALTHRLSPWLWCSLVLTGTHDFGKSLAKAGRLASPVRQSPHSTDITLHLLN